MRIIVIGAHGKVALRLGPLLERAGHQTTGVVRNPAHADDVTAAGMRPIVVDVEHASTDEIAEALRDHDAVVWSAGAGGGDPARTRAVDQDAAIRSMDAARAAGVDRYVMVSYFGSRLDHGVPPDSSFFAYAEAKAAADEYLRRSGLSWTVLGPSRLTDDSGTGTIDVDAVEGAEVPRPDVAAVVAATLATPSTSGRTIRFNSGTVPIDRALGAVD